MKRKKLIPLEAMLLGTMLLTGCHKNKPTNSTSAKDNNKIETIQDFSYDDIKNDSFIVLYNYDARTTEYHIVHKKLFQGEEESNYACFDILTVPVQLLLLSAGSLVSSK